MSRRALRRGNWSVQELERLRQLLPRRGVEVTATLLRRSPDCVYRKAMEIMRQAPRRAAWSVADDDLLRCAWGVLDRRLLGALVGRSPGEVTSRAAELRGRLHRGPWSAAERQQLKELYGTRRDEDLVVALQRPEEEVVAVARQLCLAKDKRFAAASRSPAQGGVARRESMARPMPRWTQAEVRVLQSSYAGTDNLRLARQLGRSVASVANKANQLGLRKSPELLARIGRVNVGQRYGRAVSDGQAVAARNAADGAEGAATAP